MPRYKKTTTTKSKQLVLGVTLNLPSPMSASQASRHRASFLHASMDKNPAFVPAFTRFFLLAFPCCGGMTTAAPL